MRRIVAMCCAVLAAAGVMVGPGSAATTPELRMNQIQVKGSHNSYHVEPGQSAIDVMIAFEPTAYLLQYTHDPLTTQLEDQGVRQFELDLWVDVDGDLYLPFGTTGFKTLHIESIDENSTCRVFLDCLEELEAWSDANPDHVPVTILLELKDDDEVPIGGKVPDEITPERLLDLDDEIRSGLGADDLITPDFVRGLGRAGGADGAGTTYPDVESAILDYGWPTLDDTRGKFLFVLDNMRDEYVNGDPTLTGRVAFPPSSPGNPDAGFIKLNDSIGDYDAIVDAVEAGYLVRTRADYPIETGLSGDDANLTAALSSGAQFVSGDYLKPDDYARYDADFAARYGLDFDPDRPAYETLMPGGTPARCNPRTAPPGCTSRLVEDLGAAEATTTTTTTTTPEPDDDTTTTTSTVTTVAPSPVATPAPLVPVYTG